MIFVLCKFSDLAEPIWGRFQTTQLISVRVPLANTNLGLNSWVDPPQKGGPQVFRPSFLLTSPSFRGSKPPSKTRLEGGYLDPLSPQKDSHIFRPKIGPNRPILRLKGSIPSGRPEALTSPFEALCCPLAPPFPKTETYGYKQGVKELHGPQAGSVFDVGVVYVPVYALFAFRDRSAGL